MADLLKAIGDFFAMFGDKVDEDRARNAITAIQTANTDAALTAITAIFPPALLALPTVRAAILARQGILTAQGAGGPYADIAKGLYDGFQVLAPVMGKAATDTLQAGMSTAMPAAAALAAGVVDPLIAAIVQGLAAGGKSVPPDVVAKLKGVLLPALSLGLTLELATNLAELIHPTKELGFPGVSHFIHDVVGFKAMTESYVHPLREALIEVPTRYNIMRLVQPWAIRPQEAVRLVQKRLITPEQYADTLRYTGIQEQYVPLLQSDVWRELSMRDIQRMFDISRPDPVWTREKVKRMAFNDADVEKILPTLTARAVQKELGDIRALQRSQYKAGVLGRSDYAAKLAARGVTGAEAAEFLDAVDAEREFDEREELRKLYELKFLQHRSTESELRAALHLLNLSDAMVDARVKYLQQRVLGKLQEVDAEKTLTQSQIVKGYTAGTLTKQAAAKRIDDQGWSAADAMFVLDLEDWDAAAAVVTEWIRAYEKQATNLRLSADDLRAKYLALGKSEAWADARLAYVTELILGKEKTV